MTTVPSTTNTSAAGTRTLDNASKGFKDNYSDFLKLLTTQLKNQDPTQPADTNQLTQQIAMLSQVEQQINSNYALQNIASLLTSNQVNTAVSYIGRQIDAVGNQTALINSNATLVYDLPADTTTATITIKDASGKVVFTGPGTNVAGRNQVAWHGTMTNGETAKSGAYSFTVSAKNSKGESLDDKVKTFTSGMVLAVETADDGTAELSLGVLSVPIKDVKAIYTATVVQENPDDGSDNETAQN